MQGQQGLWPRIWKWCLLTCHPCQEAQAPGAGPGQAVHPNPCCGRQAPGGEAWASLPAGELGAGPRAEGRAADHSPVGTRDAGSCTTLSQGCCGASPGPSSPQDTLPPA